MSDGEEFPTETTSLLTSSAPTTPKPANARLARYRVPSRSSITTGRRTPPPRPIPVRKSHLNTLRIQLILITLTVLTFVSAGILVILLLNTRFSATLAYYLPKHRGSRFLPPWFAFVGMWFGLSGLSLFWNPTGVARLSLKISMGLLSFDLILLVMVPLLLHQESLLTVFTLLYTLLMATWVLYCNNTVQTAKDKEAQLIHHGSITVREAELRAQMLFMADGYWLGRLWHTLKVVFSFLMVFITSILLLFITVDLLIRAIDSTQAFPLERSTKYKVQPPGAPYSYNVHLACKGPTVMRPPPQTSLGKESEPEQTTVAGVEDKRSRRIPTILYESMSGVTGYEGASWLTAMRENRQIGRTCIWDRPGYGFSDASPVADMGHVVEALWAALQESGEKGPFLLVGAGYGGILSRVFSSRHANLTHSHLFIDAHTSHTYFLNPQPRSPFIHYFLPSLFLPLSFMHFAGNRLQHLSSPRQNGLMASTISQEAFLSHSWSSPSFRALLESLRDYPADAPTIVLSSSQRMQEDTNWARSQRDLWDEVVDERGRVRWTVVGGEDKALVGHDICSDVQGKKECEEAVMELLWA